MMRNTGRTRSMLDGIPLALKGNWALKGVPMNTQRTGLLRDHTPAASATLVTTAEASLASLHCCSSLVYFVHASSALFLTPLRRYHRPC